ncbi:S-layer homology domain-containing protein [Paramaledivibacter caminithermalis]|uniref:S-layer homology domain-containing protein n=1 Tax=Paramaledivibacter caminithermalis (strain DSM 15212 / CIP 107654 / DViRD3) TaxID=1121301 RepID=A0A1M6R8R9_PARC5|nr:S-layer homology domain-containing protein [Paramaledivibacter caminithermalis]SHK28852.1 S-layer homology domain-containing protein [Paramaledivibacter caminithermalis DSM 15212]
MKKTILTILLIFCFTLQSFAGISVDIDVDDDGDVDIKVESSYEKEPIAIEIYDKDRKYYINQDITDKEGNFKFDFKAKEDEEYKGKINIKGKKEKFSFSTQEEEEVVYVYVKGYEGRILSKTEVEFKKNDTVLDVLKRVLNHKDIQYKIEDEYVKSIDGQSEFDKGAKSGWMFSVNGEFPKISAGSVEVKEGDYIRWLYTMDLGIDIGADSEELEDIEDEIKKAWKAVKDSKTSENKILKSLNNVIGILDDNFSKIKNEDDAEDLIDYIIKITKIIEKAKERIESKVNKKETVEILSELLKFLVKAVDEIDKEQVESEAMYIASRTVAIALEIIGEIQDAKEIDGISNDIIESVVKINNKLSKENTITIDMINECKDEIQIYLPKGILQNIFKKGIDKLEVKTEIASFNIEPDTFNEKMKDKEIILKIRRRKYTIDKPENSIEAMFEAIVGGEEIKVLSSPMKISFHYNGDIGDNKDITIYLLKDDGGIEAVSGEWNIDKQRISFKTSHLCKYFVRLSKNKFTDLNGYSWAKDAVEIMVCKGIVNGRTDTKFDPHENITRAEFAALITRMLGYKSESDDYIPFEDVDEGSWYYKAVAVAYKNGLINGRSERTFDPKGNITRQEMTKIIAKVLQKESVDLAEDKKINFFKDIKDIAPWAQASVELAARKGIVTGNEEGRFAPTEKANRVQAVVMLYRLYLLLWK